MQKRTERNKKLYEEINAVIAEMEKKKLNKDFADSNKTMQEINPALFGGQTNSNTKTKKKKKLTAQKGKFVCLSVLAITGHHGKRLL